MNNAIFKPKYSFFIAFSCFLLRGSVWGQIDSSNIAPYDIIISEFMAKPLANGKLPNSEYIELFNRTSKTVNLKNLRLYNDKKYSVLPIFLLKPNNYVTVYKKNAQVSFKAFGDTLALDSLFTLSNPNDIFYLATRGGKIIDAASYDLTLYRDSKKASGGVTLERTNVNFPCHSLGWDGSNDPNGGTPSRPNSVNSNDESLLEVDRYYLKSSSQIGLVFNKNVDSSSAFQAINYQISNNLTLRTDSIIRPLFNEIILKTSDNLKKDIDYQLIIKKTLRDCLGSSQKTKGDTLRIKLPETNKIDSVTVNEILFNPETGGSRFIELYNKSNKVYDLKEFKIGNKSSTVSIDKSMLFFPKTYIVLTDNPMYIQEHYKTFPFRKNILKLKLPTWNETTDTVILKGGLPKDSLDAFTYHKSWHNPLLANTEGVSLEKVHPNKPSSDAANWQSAAQTVGFATPAQQNSQFDTTQAITSKQFFTLQRKKISPDSDGFEDFLSLNYRFDKTGYSATITIFDDKGRRVKSLRHNDTLGTEGSIEWDGETEENTKARIGIYILLIEWVGPKGETGREKLPFIVAGRL
ncbi:MAG: lamin tail domain-containing protein [Saprospiraceae bacterium]|nr:lamin tail domain-containing protein [Saprospiraceae bacterium]